MHYRHTPPRGAQYPPLPTYPAMSPQYTPSYRGQGQRRANRGQQAHNTPYMNQNNNASASSPQSMLAFPQGYPSPQHQFTPPQPPHVLESQGFMNVSVCAVFNEFVVMIRNVKISVQYEVFLLYIHIVLWSLKKCYITLPPP